MDFGMKMAVMFHLTVLFFVTREIIFAYELKCPHSSQRRFRSAVVCKGTPASSYSCLYDIKNRIYIESCNQPEDFVLQGEKYVISGGRLSNPCETDRYQPFNFLSSLQSMCYYQKSLCCETGQLIFSQRSTKDDSTCRCDYKNSYAFVTKPMNHFFCVPSEEDCACYHVQCPVKTLLSSDNECKQKDEYEIDKGCEQMATKTLNNRLPTERINIIIDMEANLTRESWSKALLAAVCLAYYLVIVLFIAVMVLICSDLAEDNCCMLIQDNTQFYQDIIGHWSYLTDQIQPKPILKVLLRKKLITELVEGQTGMLDIENQNIFILLLFLQKSSSRHVRLFESLLKDQSVHLQRITVKRWPKRDEAKCKEKHDLVKDILATTNLKDFLNYCFENFVFSPEDYENVVKEQYKIESLTRNVDRTLPKGSIDCLKTFLEETIRKHETPEVSNYLEELKKNLPPAIFVDFTTSHFSSLTTKSEATEKDRWKNYQIQFSLFTSDKSTIQLMSSSRMLTCAKWFIQEIAMYPDPITIVDSSIDLIPLVADAFYRLNKSISTKRLTHLLELYLCGEDIIKQLSKNMQVQVSMQVETGSKSNVIESNDDETVSPNFLDNSSLLIHQRVFLKKEIQPQPVLDALPTIYKKLFKDIDLENGSRVHHAEQILDIIAKNEDRNKLSDCFLEVFKRDYPHIYRRLKNIKDAYSEKCKYQFNFIN